MRSCILLIMLLFNGLLQTVLSQSARPNIIYIMADDLGYADLSCYGRRDYQTPHLDRLASQGMKFMNAYAAAPLCTPTRTSFMTGRYPARTPIGLMEPLRTRQKDSLVGLNPEYTSIATLLRNKGYETWLVGKWHLGYGPKYSPNKNGFDYFFGFNAGGTDYVSHTSFNGKPDLYENEKPVTRKGYLTDIWMEKTVEIIKKEHRFPFFLSLMFNAPHWPLQAPGDDPYPDGLDWRTTGKKEKFIAMMKSLDEAVGKIMQALDETGLTANTVVIFTSDNGGEKFSDMGIYSGGKAQLWEGGIRVPAFARWPGMIPANSISEQLIITMDWTATILAIVGAKPDPAFPPDGVSLLDICKGKRKSFERTFYWRLFQSVKQKAIRHGKWKYLQTEKGEFLFDLISDPGEKNEIRATHPAVFQKLKKKYAAWEMEMLKPVEL